MPAEVLNALPPTAQGSVHDWMKEGGFGPLVSEIANSDSIRQLLTANALTAGSPLMMATDPIVRVPLYFIASH